MKVGSTVALHCVVRGALEPPSYIIWYHDAHQLLSENQQKWKIKLDRGMPDSDGDIPNVVSETSFFRSVSDFRSIRPLEDTSFVASPSLSLN